MSTGIALPLDTYSPDQLSELVLELQDLAAAARDSAVRASDDRAEPSPQLSALLTENQVATTDVARIEGLSRAVAAVLEQAPTVHILLVSMPSRTVRRQFTTWFRTNISPLTLLTFAARSDIGGGAIIQAGSHLYNLSFRRSILDNKARLSEIAGV